MVASPVLPQDHSYPRIWVWMLIAAAVQLFLATPIATWLHGFAPKRKSRR
jgi:hypothetical protein